MDGWTAVSVPELRALALRRLTGTEYRVLLAILSAAEFGNLMRLSQSDIGRLTNLSRQSVSDAYQRLIDDHLVAWVDLERQPPLKPERVLMVSPLLSWRGHARDHRAAITDWIGAHPEVAEV